MCFAALIICAASISSNLNLNFELVVVVVVGRPAPEPDAQIKSKRRPLKGTTKRKEKKKERAQNRETTTVQSNLARPSRRRPNSQPACAFIHIAWLRRRLLARQLFRLVQSWLCALNSFRPPRLFLSRARQAGHQQQQQPSLLSKADGRPLEVSLLLLLARRSPDARWPLKWRRASPPPKRDESFIMIYRPPPLLL